jgi:hypothetical protein
MVDYRTDLLNLRTAGKLKLPHLTEEGADQVATAERQEEKKHYLQANHLARLQQSFCLNTNTHTGCWKSNTRT